jgi:hypothetical protein
MLCHTTSYCDPRHSALNKGALTRFDNAVGIVALPISDVANRAAAVKYRTVLRQPSFTDMRGGHGDNR